MDVQNKAVLVTGGASGIGKAIVKEFLKHGAKVAFVDIDEENGNLLYKKLVTKYGASKIVFTKCDVTDYSQFEDAFESTWTAFGTLDIVVNNANVRNDRLWEFEVDVNLNSVIRGTLLAMHFMGKDREGQGGIVINISSDCGLKPYISLPIYSATKHAVIALARAFGDNHQVSSNGIRVFALCAPAKVPISNDIRKILLSPNYDEAWKQDTHKLQPQKNGHVAKCLIQILPTAPSGSVWLVENSLPARQIEYKT